MIYMRFWVNLGWLKSWPCKFIVFLQVRNVVIMSLPNLVRFFSRSDAIFQYGFHFCMWGQRFKYEITFGCGIYCCWYYMHFRCIPIWCDSIFTLVNRLTKYWKLHHVYKQNKIGTTYLFHFKSIIMYALQWGRSFSSSCRDFSLNWLLGRFSL